MKKSLIVLECLRHAAEKQIPIPKLGAHWLDNLFAQAKKLPEDENEAHLKKIIKNYQVVERVAE